MEKSRLINIYDYVICYDDNIGVIHHIPSKRIVKCSSSMAKILKSGIEEKPVNRYVERYLSDNFEVKNTCTENIQKKTCIKKRVITRLEIVVSTKCNLNCVYCYADGGNYGMHEEIMPPKTADAIINYIIKKDIKIEEIMFFGGEPLLAYNIIMYICDRLNEILEDMPVYTMVTNLTYLPEEFIGYIVKYRIGITVSIDGPKEITDCLRVSKNGESTYDAIIQNRNRLIQRGINISCIECTYTQEHERMGYSKEMLRDFFEQKFSECVLLLCNEEKYELAIRKNESAYLEKRMENINDIMNVILIHKWYQKNNVNRFCDAGFSKIEIYPQGDIYPCHGFRTEKRWKLGNIFDEAWEESDECFSIRGFLMDVKNESNCMHCTARDVCAHCMAEIFEEDKVCLDDICRRKRKGNEIALLEFCKLR